MTKNLPAHLLQHPEGFAPYTDERASVRYGNTYRIDAAREQAQSAPPSKEHVAALANVALTQLGINPVADPLVTVDSADIAPDGTLALDYNAIAREHQLDDRRDVVNIRFSTEGHPVLVAVSDDVNFCPLPSSPEQYADQAYSTAAVILKELETDWDYDEFLLFPLAGLSETGFSRHDAEMAIGNHLLANGVALLDKYSHCY